VRSLRRGRRRIGRRQGPDLRRDRFRGLDPGLDRGRFGVRV